MDDEDAAGPTVPGLPGNKPTWMAKTVAAPAPGAAEPAPAPSIFDPLAQRYAERAELGRGGMGRVVEAHDRALDRAVAIKQSLAASDTDLARFEREVRITAKLQHPSVVPIHDVGRDAEGRPYYVMRKVDGEPLADAIGRAEDVRARLALVPSLLGAIDACAYAHARGIVHRDIKPWNILLGPYGETLLIDWGIARELGEADVEIETSTTGPQLTRAGSAYGTPGFLSPEQARGAPVDASTDVYSLGATLYFILTRAVPFGTDNPTQAIEDVAAGASPDFAAIPDEVPRELVAIAIKAMAPSSTARYANAGELAADVRRFLAGQLVAAHQYTARERFFRWLRRHRIAASVAAIAVVAIAVISIVAVRRIVAERDEATSAKVAEAEARARAERSADDKLVDRARTLLATDPTSALGVLRTLRPGSGMWSEVRPIVRAAMSGGVDRALGRLPGWISGLAVSPDGMRVAAASTGRVTIFGLEDRSVRPIAVDLSIDELRWRDPHTIVALDHQSGERVDVSVIDVDTGAITSLDLGPVRQLELEGSDLIVLDAAGAVTRVTAAGERRILFEGAAIALDVSASGHRIAIAEKQRLTILDGAERTRIEVPEPALRDVRISATGAQIIGLSIGLAREWTLGAASPPRAWPRPTNGLADVRYASERPLGWTSDSGFESLDPGGSTLRWMVRELRPGVLTTHILPTRRGAVLVTDGGSVALATEAGVAPLPHRPLAVTRATVDPSGDHLVLGIDSGEVLSLDLSAAWPTLYPSAGEVRLAAIGAGRILVDDGAIRAIDLATGVRTELAPRAAGLDLVGGDHPIVMRRDVSVLELISLDGKVLARHDRVLSSYASRDAVTYVDTDGGVWRRALAPLGPPQKIGALGDLTGATLVLDAIDSDVVITLYRKAGVRSVLFSGGSQRDIPLDPTGFIDLQGRSADGAYWMIVLDDGSLWRVAPDGARARIPVGYDVRSALVREDRVWVFGDSSMTELAQDGRTVRTMGMRHLGRLWRIPDGVLMADTDGIVELAPAAALRRVLRAPGIVREVVATSDGKSIAASLELDADRFTIAVWTDPVPTDGMAAYLDRVTNARLVDGSDAVTWDPPRAR